MFGFFTREICLSLGLVGRQFKGYEISQRSFMLIVCLVNGFGGDGMQPLVRVF